MMLSDMRKVAMKAREDFEEGIVDTDNLKYLYQDYNPVEDIDLFIEKSKELFPKLNCGLSSLYLKKLLKTGKVINGKYENHNHTFLILNNLVIDITADQYGGPKVYVGPLKSPWAL